MGEERSKTPRPLRPAASGSSLKQWRKAYEKRCGSINDPGQLLYAAGCHVKGVENNEILNRRKRYNRILGSTYLLYPVRSGRLFKGIQNSKPQL